jgi:hypothetical protein
MLFRVNFGNALFGSRSRCITLPRCILPHREIALPEQEETRVDVVAATKQKVLVLRVRNSELLL